MKKVNCFVAAMVIFGASMNANALTSGDFQQIRITADSICIDINKIESSGRELSVDAIVNSRLNLFFTKVSAGVKAKYKTRSSRGLLAKDISRLVEDGRILVDECKLDVLHTLVSALKPQGKGAAQH